MLHHRPELERIARPHDDVGDLPRLEGAVALRHAEDLGRRQGHRPQRLVPRHAIRHRIPRLLAQVAGVVSVGLEERDLHPGARQERRVLVADSERVVGGDVVERLDQHGDAGPSDDARDLPPLRRTRQDQLQVILPGQAQRRLDVTAPIGDDDEGQITREHRTQRRQIGRRGDQRVHLGACPVPLAAPILERVVEHAPQPLRRASARATSPGVLGPRRQLGHHGDGRLHQHRLQRGAVQIDQHRLPADQALGGDRERRRNPRDTGDRDQRGGGIDPLGDVERRRHRVVPHRGVVRLPHRADLGEPHLAGAVNQPGRDPFAGRVDARRVRRDRHARADRRDPAVAQQHRRALEARAGHREHRAPGDGDRLRQQHRDHRSLPGGGSWPSSKSERGWCAASLRS